MLSMSLKTLNIILMCFDGKNSHLKKNKRNYSNSNNKRMSKVLKSDFVSSFVSSFINSNFVSLFYSHKKNITRSTSITT